MYSVGASSERPLIVCSEGGDVAVALIIDQDEDDIRPVAAKTPAVADRSASHSVVECGQSSLAASPPARVEMAPHTPLGLVGLAAG